MSGVFGLANSRREDASSCLESMGRSMAHLPWFEMKTWAAPRGAVGLGQLGIGVFNAEPQPVHDEGARLHLVVAGELYNADVLRRRLAEHDVLCRDESDAELLLCLYRHDQFGSLGRAEGAFAVAVWDEAAETLVLATDRAGLYPLLYAHFDGRLVFAPEMKAILLHPAFRRDLDLTALAEYVRFQFLLGDKTFFSGLRLLPNASVLRYHRTTDTVSLDSYWDFSRLPAFAKPPSLPEAAEEAGRLLGNAVRRLAQGPNRLGLFLSGGLDARMILGLLGTGHEGLPTATYGAPGSRDVVYAQRLAALARADHHYFPISDGRWVPATVPLHLEFTEGFHSWIHAHGLSVLPSIRGLMEVNLSGLNGGELTWEDPLLYRAEDDTAFFNRLFHALVSDTTWPGLTEAEAHDIFAPGLGAEANQRVFESLRREIGACDGWPYARQAAHFSSHATRRLFQCYTLFNRAYVEQRFPFHDSSYADFVYALPPEYLFRRTLRKAVLLRYAPSLARVPYDKTDLPIIGSPWRARASELTRRSEKYINRHVYPVFREYPSLYVDYEKWLRGELSPWAEGVLFDGWLEGLGLFNMAAIRSLWARHQSGREANIIGKLASVMSYGLMTQRLLADASGRYQPEYRTDAVSS
jgi:asparagine synthase (glutamine-hydrolysing)